MIAPWRMGLALAASLALHGTGLAVLEGLPPGLGEASPPPAAGADALRVSLRAAQPQPAAPAVRIPQKLARPHTASPGTPPAPVYYPVRELDERPLVRVHVEPQFPAGTRETERRIALELFIGLDGAVDRIAILSSRPQGAFENAALRAFSAARFTPGRKAGMPVRSRMTLEVLFGEPVPLAKEHSAWFLSPR